MTIDGVEDLEKSLQELSKRTGRAVYERSLKKAAQPMLKRAKELTPVRFGDLEHSLKIERVVLRDAGKMAFAGVMQAGGSRSEARMAMRDAYRAEGGAVATMALGPDILDGGSVAHLVEFGTGPRYHKNGKFVGEMPPDPFLRPAFEQEGGPTIARLRPILAAEIEKSAKRAAARAARLAAKG